MFFTQLAAVLDAAGQTAKLTIVVSRATDGEQLNIVVVPETTDAKGPATALTRPLSLTATPAELDAEFAGVVQQYAAHRASLAEQIAAEVTILKADAEASAKRAADKLAAKKPGAAKAVPPAKATAATTSAAAGDADEDRDESDDDGEAATATASAASAPAAGNTDLNLFG